MDTDKAKRWLRQVLYRTSLRARGLGVDFLVCEEDISLPDRCPVLSIELQYGSVAFDGATLARKDQSRGWIAQNTWIISRSAHGMLVNLKDGFDLRVPFAFLSESDRKRLYSEVRERHERQLLIAEFNISFPAESTKAEFPAWLSTSREESPEDAVERLRQELNSELG